MSIVAEDAILKINCVETSPFGTNTYIITCRSTGEAVVIDAPGQAQKILQRLKEAKPKYILMTHSHMDHTGALFELKTELEIPVAAHPDDSGRLPFSPDVFLQDGDTVSFGQVELKVLHTPGHTPGSLCFLSGQYLISGDTLFPGGPGKTQTPGDLTKILEKLEEKIFVLPDDVHVFPGHGPSTILKKEKQEFAVFSSRTHPPDLCGDVLWLSS